jgi:hypothetical protein
MNRTWTIGQLFELTGASRDLVGDWRRRGFLTLRDDQGNIIISREDRSGWQRFSFLDLLYIRSLVVLTAADVSVSVAHPLANEMVPWFVLKDQWRRAWKPQLIVTFKEDGLPGWKIVSTRKQLMDELTGGNTRFPHLPARLIVDIGSIFNDVRDRIKSADNE